MRFNTDFTEKNPRILNKKTVCGHEYTLTDRYLLRDGEPYIYAMGEYHFSRADENDWEREIIKMKNGGIEIVSSYLFWNHHEQEKGKFNFTGNRNLRKFIDTCEKSDMPFWLRLGPWAHGEARLGGFPDWLKDSCRETRSLDEEYLFYVRRFFEEVYRQTATSKNIIGIQIENEYGGESPEYMQKLYDMARETGFDALIFSATGWSSPLPECLVPMFGVYPEHPWVQHTETFNDGKLYGFYDHDADNYWRRVNGGTVMYPRLTCELGGGNQSTYVRRPLILSREVAALTVSQLGTGAKGLGYYMYHGGINPVDADSDRIISSFQESRESGYPTDCPVMSYDFQSPLGDCGQYRQSYFELKNILRFVKCEERSIALMEHFRDTDIPEPDDRNALRTGIISNGRSGYLFWINVFHGVSMPEKEGTAYVYLQNDKVEIPLSVPRNSWGIIPFNYAVGTEKLKWVNAFPVCRTHDTVMFSVNEGSEPEYMTADGKTGNLRDIGSIGGMKIVLAEPERPDCERTCRLSLHESERRISFGIFGHIITKESRHLTDRTREYTADIPEGTSYVSIRAEGNIGAVFEEKQDGSFRLISDHFIDGDEWIADVRSVRKIRLKIQPFCEEERKTVYLEKKFAAGDFTPEVFALRGEEVFVRGVTGPVSDI